MQIVVIYNWPEVTAELTKELATIMQVTAFDARQRLAGVGPAIVGSFADLPQAQDLLTGLNDAGFESFIVSSNPGQAQDKNQGRPLVVRYFELAEEGLRLEVVGGQKGTVSYGSVSLLLPASCTTQQAESQTVTEKKFSVGKTIMSGGLPMKKKVERTTMVSAEKSERILYLCVGDKPRFLFSQSALTYTGLGEEMKPSSELNFSFLLTELRRRCPVAEFDDRLIRRTEQAKLLGPLLSPETFLELAVNVLARTKALKG